MAKIASELLIERLAEWGVDTVFGLPGDGINGIMEGLRRNREKVRFCPGAPRGGRRLHGDGVRQGTGRLGVCLATSGPARSTCSTGCTTPSSTTSLSCAITGMQETSVLGTGYQQEVHARPPVRRSWPSTT